MLFYSATDGVSITNSNRFFWLILIRIRIVFVLVCTLWFKNTTPHGVIFSLGMSYIDLTHFCHFLEALVPRSGNVRTYQLI
jgi:hypothetical protein